MSVSLSDQSQRAQPTRAAGAGQGDGRACPPSPSPLKGEGRGEGDGREGGGAPGVSGEALGPAHQPPDASRNEPRRAPWRQRLIEAETGLRLGIRADSTLFAHFFLGIIFLVASLVIGLTAAEWALVVLSMGISLSAALLHQLLGQIADYFRHHLPSELEQVTWIGTAAAMVTHLTAGLVVLILLWGRLHTAWTG
jgi:diacylglycerol kinase